MFYLITNKNINVVESGNHNLYIPDNLAENTEGFVRPSRMYYSKRNQYLFIFKIGNNMYYDTKSSSKKELEKNGCKVLFVSRLNEREETIIKTEKVTSSSKLITYEIAGKMVAGLRVYNHYGNCGSCLISGLRRNSQSKKALDRAKKVLAKEIHKYMEKHKYNQLILADGNGSYFEGESEGAQKVGGFNLREIIKEIPKVTGEGLTFQAGESRNRNTGNLLSLFVYYREDKDYNRKFTKKSVTTNYMI